MVGLNSHNRLFCAGAVENRQSHRGLCRFQTECLFSGGFTSGTDSRLWITLECSLQERRQTRVVVVGAPEQPLFHQW